MAFKIDYVSDWGARLLSRFYEQFKEKTNLTALARDVLGPQFQALEDTAQALFTLVSIDDSEGFQLDLLGRVVGQLRLGVDDATYRLYLRARVASNRSSGTVEDLYSVFRALYGLAVSMVYTAGDDAAFELRIRSVLTAAEAVIGGSFLTDAKDAGVFGIFEWQQNTDDEMFTFGVFSTLNAAPLAGATTLTVLSTSGFPLAGSVTLDGGLAAEETVTYTVTSSTTLAVSALVNAHPLRATVEVVGDIGLGWGDSSDASVGGEFAGAFGA